MPIIKQTTLYTLPELREAHPDAYAKAWERHRTECAMSGPDWAEENADSLRAILDAAGASIGHRGRLIMDINKAALSGRRAWAWLERLNENDMEHAASEEQFIATNEGTLYTANGDEE